MNREEGEKLLKGVKESIKKFKTDNDHAFKMLNLSANEAAACFKRFGEEAKKLERD